MNKQEHVPIAQASGSFFGRVHRVVARALVMTGAVPCLVWGQQEVAVTGAAMALMRLKDGPIIGGASQEARAQHPDAKHGPVLTLPSGWEPSWSASELPGQVQSVMSQSKGPLAQALHGKGWIVYSAKIERGDWDLFLIRPDGAERRRLTDTPQFNEAGARFSPDGTRLLYYRMSKAEAVDNNTYGTYDLVIANADGSDAVIYGRGFPWATWSPDGRQIACLETKGIQIVDLASRKVIRELPRKGIVSQLGWSPDGKRFVGTANGLGEFWNIGSLELTSGAITAVSETDRYNCTPDWMPDSTHIVYARGIIPQKGGRAELWAGTADGRERLRIYGEPDRHIYGACSSPDGRYVLFTRSVEDLGKVLATEMAIIRWPTSGETRSASAQPSPERVDLGPGWEPHWTPNEAAGR